MTHFVDDSGPKQYGLPLKFDLNYIGTTGLVHSPLDVDGLCTRLKRDNTLIDEYLYDLLSLATPHGDEKRLFKTMRKFLKVPFEQDEFGNVRVLVGTNVSPPTMFSCHLDTIHAQPFDLRLFHTDNVDTQFRDFIFAGRKHTSEKKKKNEQVPTNLGADDKLGVWIMSNMINAGIPGLYMFHVGEERGCIGSKKVAKVLLTDPIYKNIKKAIAFDRGNYGDVVNSQHGRTCCSTLFATAFAGKMNDALVEIFQKPLDQLVRKFEPHAGVYTDTGEYMDIVPECTNLSVAYFSQHTPKEHFDPLWLNQALMPALLKIDWEALPVARDPSAYKYTPHHHSNSSYYSEWQKSTNGKGMVEAHLVTATTNATFVPDLMTHPGHYTKIPTLEGFKRITEVANRRHTSWHWDKQLVEFTHTALEDMSTYLKHAQAMARQLIKIEEETGTKFDMPELEDYRDALYTMDDPNLIPDDPLTVEDEEEEGDSPEVLAGMAHYMLDDKYSPSSMQDDIDFFHESRDLLFQEIAHIKNYRDYFPNSDASLGQAESLLILSGKLLARLEDNVDSLIIQLVQRKSKSLIALVHDISRMFKSTHDYIGSVEDELYTQMTAEQRTFLNSLMAADDEPADIGRPEEEEIPFDPTDTPKVVVSSPSFQTIQELEAAIRGETSRLPVGFRNVTERIFAYHTRYCDHLVNLATETSAREIAILIRDAKQEKEKGTTLLGLAVLATHGISIPQSVREKFEEWAKRTRFTPNSADHRLLEKGNVTCLH